MEDVGGSEVGGCVVVDGVAEGEVAGASVGGGLASVGDGEVVVGCGSPGVEKSDEQNNLVYYWVTLIAMGETQRAGRCESR